MTVLPRSGYRILIVEDHTLFAESLELALTMEGYDVRRIAATADTSSPAALLAAILRARARVVLLDLDLGRLGSSVSLIGPVVRSGAQVVVVTASADRARWGECLRYGARTVVSKARPLHDVRRIVRQVYQGQPVMERREREELIHLWHQQRNEMQELRVRLEALTPRECEVLGCLMHGETVRDVAARNVVSEATVRTQVKSILSKLGVSSQLAAVGLAHQVDWRPPEE